METFWDASKGYFTGPLLTEQMIRSAESALGYKLPDSYVGILRVRNGGTPLRCCFPTMEPTSWAKDHIRVSGIRGVGGMWGIDSDTLGSASMIREWGYPNVGIVVGECPSAGHDVVMLDYTYCGPRGEPRVIHVETECEEPQVLVLAESFEVFFQGLVHCDRYDL
jgi:hypothetical protein